MGLFEDIIEAIFKVIGLIAEGIRRVFMLVGSIVDWFGKEILPTIAIIFTVVGVSIGILAIFAPAVAVSVVNLLVYGVSVINGGTALMINTGPVAVASAMTGLKVVLATFLEAIHFRTIMAIHNIAWVLSAEYRKLLSKVFKKMSEVSEVIFGWSLGLRVIIENSRSILLTSAAALGYNYDTAQLMWITNFSDIIEKINEKSEIYMEDPEQFFFDLEEMVDQHAIDLSAGATQLIFEATMQQTIAIEKTATFATDIDSRTRESHTRIRSIQGKNYDGKIAANRTMFEGFKRNDYAPMQRQQNDSIELNRKQTMENRHETARLAFKMRTPDGQLKGIDEMQEPDKTEQEESLEDLTSRPYQEENDILAEEHAEATEEHEEELEEAERAEEERPKEEPGPAKPTKPLEVKPGPPVNAWFVGDF